MQKTLVGYTDTFDTMSVAQDIEHEWARLTDVMGVVEYVMDQGRFKYTLRFVTAVVILFGTLQGEIPGTWGAGSAAWIMTINLKELKDEVEDHLQQRDVTNYDD